MRDPLRTHPSVVNFLDRVCARIWDKRRKAEVREELLSHLEAAMAESGSDIEIDELIENFGDPDVLGSNLRRAQRTWVQKILRLTAGGAVLGVLTLYFSSRHFANFYEEKIRVHADNLALHMSRFETEQERLAAIPLFEESTTDLKADAGEFLNDRLAKNDLIALEPEVGAWIRQWWAEPIPDNLKKVDLQWVQRLRAYDHWDLFASGPNSKFLGPEAKAVNPFTLPVPEFQFLPAGARLHLRRGLDKRDIVPALEDVRHLARLSYTTETLIGSMVAIALLKMERVAYGEAIRRGIIAPGDYPVFEVEELEQLRKTLWVTTGFADYSAPIQARQVFLSQHWPIGACSAIGESAQSYVLAAAYLEKIYPFERDMQERLQVVDELLEKSKPHCRLKFHRQAVVRYKEYAQTMIDDGFSMADGIRGNFEKYRFILGRHLPFFRQALGLELIAIAKPSFTLVYEREN